MELRKQNLHNDYLVRLGGAIYKWTGKTGNKNGTHIVWMKKKMDVTNMVVR